MALGAALVDRARLRSMHSTGLKVEGTTRATEVTGAWFKARLTLPEAAEAPVSGGARKREVVRPTLMVGKRDFDGNTIAFGAQDRVEVNSPQLGREVWEVVADPKPIRKKRSVIGWEVTLARVEEHSGSSAL